MRDRVVLIGESAPTPREVDSLDEVLFVLPREQVRREPLAERPSLAWHAYAVEYGMRLRRAGGHVGAMDLLVTHNSLTTNLARLDEAHRSLATEYPDLLPVHTTCGVVAAGLQRPPRRKRFARHRWRVRWMRDSLRAARATRASGTRDVVLSDIRLDIDDLLSACAPSSVHVANLDRGPFTGRVADRLTIRRHDALLDVEAVTMSGLSALIAGRPPSRSLLCTNLDIDDLQALAPLIQAEPTLVGVHGDAGCWLLIGPASNARVEMWTSVRAHAFAQPKRSLDRATPSPTP
jgi:hypothetical protein